MEAPPTVTQMAGAMEVGEEASRVGRLARAGSVLSRVGSAALRFGRFAGPHVAVAGFTYDGVRVGNRIGHWLADRLFPLEQAVQASHPAQAAAAANQAQRHCPEGEEGETLYRRGIYWESAKKLTEQAAKAEASEIGSLKASGLHGVSVSSVIPNVPFSSAPRTLVEQHFEVIDTPTRNDPFHKTVIHPSLSRRTSPACSMRSSDVRGSTHETSKTMLSTSYNGRLPGEVSVLENHCLGLL